MPKKLFFFLLVLQSINLFAQKFEWIKETYPGVDKMVLGANGNLFYYGLDGVTSNHTVNDVTLRELEYPNPQIFLAKHDQYGKMEWVFSSKNTELSKGLTLVSVTSDDNENIYATGHFRGSHQFDDYLLTATPIDSLTNFIFKLNTNGDLLWAKSLQSDSKAVNINKVVTDSAGNSFISFLDVNNLHYDGDTIVETEKNSHLTLRINSNGRYIWHELTEGNYRNHVISMPNQSFIFARNYRNEFIRTGKDTILTESDALNGILHLYDANGDLKKTCELLKSYTHGHASIITLTSDDEGNIFVLLSTDLSMLKVNNKEFKIRRKLTLLKLNNQLEAVWCTDLPPDFRYYADQASNHFFLDAEKNPVVTAQLTDHGFYYDPITILGLLSTTINAYDGKLLKNKFIPNLGIKSIGGFDAFNNLYVAGIVDVNAAIMDTQFVHNNEVAYIAKISEVVYIDFPSDEFTAFPNPFSDGFTVVQDHEGEGEFIINVYSIDGKLMVNETVVVEGLLQCYVPTDTWKDGVYLVETVLNGVSSTIKTAKVAR